MRRSGSDILKEKAPMIYKVLLLSSIRITRCRVKHYIKKNNPKKAVEIVYNNKERRIDWNNPKNINEKLQCLKVGKYYNNSVITQCVDKVTVKDYVKNKGIKCRCAETYQVCNKPDEINWEKLPEKFVIKCNHGCGYNIICNNKDSVDKQEVIGILNEWLKEDFWINYCEPQYKFIAKKILIEENLGENIKTYKFYCFNGVPRILYVSSNGEGGNDEKDLYLDYFDMDFKWLDITLGEHLHLGNKVVRPENWEELKIMAAEFAREFPFVRVDLYDVEGDIYLSELTFMPTGGYMELKPEKTLEEWGSWLEI